VWVELSLDAPPNYTAEEVALQTVEEKFHG
jgi:hypothetical protein